MASMTISDIQFNMASPKIATLDKEFLISESGIYDYYQTNSGIFPKNPFGNDSSSGDDGSGVDADTKATVSKLAAKMNSAANQTSAVSDNPDNYNDVDDVLSSIITLKKSVQTLNN